MEPARPLVEVTLRGHQHSAGFACQPAQETGEDRGRCSRYGWQQGHEIVPPRNSGGGVTHDRIVRSPAEAGDNLGNVGRDVQGGEFGHEKPRR